ncbi:MAG: hypothetical protein ACAH83_01660 [Alphaproteobacteria bacterium]
MRRKTDSKYLSNDVREVLEASRHALKTAKTERAEEPQELEDTPDMSALFGLAANGCGRHEAAQEETDFISPLLLAA